MKYFFVSLFMMLFAATGYSQTTPQEWFDKGKLLKDKENYNEAAQAFKKAVALKPTYAEALHQLGWCYNELSMFAEALDVLKKEEKNNPPDKAGNFMELGYAYKGLKKYDDAILYFDKAIAEDPEYALAYKERGVAHFKNQNYEKALNDFNKYASMETNITDVEFFYDKAWCENDLEKYEAAILSLEDCTRLDMGYAEAYSELGFSYFKLNQNDKALENYHVANRMDEKKQLGILGIADVYYTNLKNYDSAMNYLEQAISFNKTNKSIYYKLGWCYNDKERYSDAVPVLKQAVSIDPAYNKALEELAYSLYKLYKFDEALVHLKKAISTDPKSELGRYYAGLCYEGKGNIPELQKMYDQLKNMNSDYADDLNKRILILKKSISPK